jgi:uncharacterized membrane protein YdjX (TVP38/TMEM64 family)
MTDEKDTTRDNALPGPPPPDAELVELEREATQSARASERRLLLMALVVAAAIALIHFTPLERYLTDVHRWKDALARFGIWASLLFGAVSTVCIAAGIPRLLFGTIAGVLFGFWEGFFVAQFSALIGSYGAFLFARWGGREWGKRRIESNRHLRALLRNPSILSVFLARQLPIAGILPNVVLGLTPVRHRVFLVGSFLGYLPSSIMVVLIGSGLGKKTLMHSMTQISLAMLGLGTAALIVWHFQKKLSGAAKKAA